MPTTPTSVTNPVSSLRASWKADVGLVEPLRGHLLAVAWATERETRKGSVLYRATCAILLQLYRKSREQELGPLAQARVLGEVVRASRGLGLLGRVGIPIGGAQAPGRRRQFPRGSSVPTSGSDGDDGQEGDA